MHKSAFSVTIAKTFTTLLPPFIEIMDIDD